jgi:hypothetical protein
LNNLFIEYQVTINRGTELSELPEKKVLKQAIIKLKSNALTSEETYNNHIKNFNYYLLSIVEGLKKVSSETKNEGDKKKVDATIGLLIGLAQEASLLIVKSIETLNGWKTYTEILESYSSELDSTLTKMFQDAVKQYEEQIKKQQELIGKTPEYTI